jgi:hypothetical protein
LIPVTSRPTPRPTLDRLPSFGLPTTDTFFWSHTGSCCCFTASNESLGTAEGYPKISFREKFPLHFRASHDNRPATPSRSFTYYSPQRFPKRCFFAFHQVSQRVS